jgi:hypothetical protein
MPDELLSDPGEAEEIRADTYYRYKLPGQEAGLGTRHIAKWIGTLPNNYSLKLGSKTE